MWGAGAVPADLTAPLTIDLDSTIVRGGRKKQGAAFGYTGVRGYHPQLATCAQTGQVLMSRLRGGSAGAARLLRLVQAQDLAQQQRSEGRDGRPDGDAGAETSERQELAGKAAACQDVPVSAALRVIRSLTTPGAAMPDTSPFTSARKTGTPASDSCSAMSWSVLVLHNCAG